MGLPETFCRRQKVIGEKNLSRRNGVWHFSAYTVVLNISASLPVHQ